MIVGEKGFGKYGMPGNNIGDREKTFFVVNENGYLTFWIRRPAMK